MAELARRSGLSVATIKFYLREGLVPPGQSTSATRASYDEGHVRRLRLVRALSELAGLRLDDVRAVLAAVDDESLSWHEAVGTAHARLAPQPDAGPAALRRVDALLRRRGWSRRDTSHRAALAHELETLAALDIDVSDELLDVYADAAESIARHEVASVEVEDRTVATEQVVAGTLLLEPVLLTLRRLAQAQVSRRTRSRR